MRLTTEWYENAVRHLRSEMEKTDLDAVLLLDPYNLYYLTGFYHQATERHLGLLVPRNGDPVYYVPKLELEMAQATIVKNVKHYFDYPGLTHGIIWMLKDMLRYKKIGIDKVRDGRDWDIVKSFNPSVVLTDIVYQMRRIKTQEEIDLILSGNYYASMLTDETARKLASGLSELDVHDSVRSTVSAVIYKDLGDEVITKSSNQGMIYGTVLYGKKTAFPDAMMDSEAAPLPGDVITSSYYMSFLNYEFESAQTYFFANVKDEYRSCLKALNDAYRDTLRMIHPGVLCCDLFSHYRKTLERAGLDNLLRHRLGHGKGLEKAEAPWVDTGDRSELKPGMVISLTPGLYKKGMAGFRFSETIVVTDNGFDYLNKNEFDPDRIVI